MFGTSFLAERTFRRALLYGINRNDILTGELLEGLESEGCRVLSGPFPAGLELNDPLGYAYDQSIEPRPYEPPLAQLLIAMNENQMKSEAERKKETMPSMTPIRLAYPPDNLSRVACEGIRTQWELLGLKVELVELEAGQTFPDREKNIADIVYVSAAVWEPVIDAGRLLGLKAWHDAKISWLDLDCDALRKLRIGEKYVIVCLTYIRSFTMNYPYCHFGKW